MEKVSFEPGCDDIYGEVTRVVGCLTLNASLQVSSGLHWRFLKNYLEIAGAIITFTGRMLPLT